ncbi:MAG: 2OG-Fe(II) oxygenase [Parvibaculales bacterium]
MLSEWSYYENLFPKSLCETIVEKAKKLPLQSGTVTEANKVDSEIRQSQISWIDRGHPDFANIFPTIDRCIAEANRKWFGLDYWQYGASSYQFTTYKAGKKGEKGDYYRPHQDSVLVNKGLSQRKISFTLQLTDPKEYEGGQFIMQYVDQQPPQDIIIQQGTMLIFPSLVFHGVHPITKGTRYSLVGWYEGPVFR